MTHHLILGGLGFIGRHVARNLLQSGARVTIADRAEAPGRIDEVATDYRRVDLRQVDWPELIGDADIVHHYAWTTIPRTANEDPVGDLEQNLRVSVELLEALRHLSGRRMVFASSGGTVYGPLRQIPAPEEHPFKPVTAYGVSKAAVEMYMAFYRASYGMDCRVARISNPFGTGQDPRRLQGAASAFIYKAFAGEEISIWGDGSVVRDYIHITDVAAGLARLAEIDAADCGDVRTFNIANGTGTSLTDILDVLAARLGRSPRVSYLPGRNFDIPTSVLDITRAREVLSWSPALSFAEGCDRMIGELEEGSTWLSSDT